MRPSREHGLHARHCCGLGADGQTEISKDLYEVPTAYLPFVENKEEMICKKTEVYQPRHSYG